jgi:hypothetical protein
MPVLIIIQNTIFCSWNIPKILFKMDLLAGGIVVIIK